MTLPAPAQWTIDHLVQFANDLSKRADQVKASISTTNGQLVAANQRAQAISDPQQRATAVAGIQSAVAEQGRIAGVYRATFQKFVDAWSSAKQWLAQQGINVSGGGLSDFGIAPLVFAIVGGAVIVAALLTVSKGLDWLEQSTGPQAKRAAALGQLVSSYTSGAISQQQFTSAASQVNAQADREKPQTPDPFGLTGTVQALVPLAAIVLAIVVLPKLIGHSRRRLRAA